MNTRLLRQCERREPGSCVLRSGDVIAEIFSADYCRRFFPNPLFRPFYGLVQVHHANNPWAGFARDRAVGWTRRQSFRAELERAARGDCNPTRNAPENWREYAGLDRRAA